ncbi:hypothetical protein CHARACLAT_030171, partial [Characodon lateralis]|nr:hypothetical protein [Characodon lateralis]
MNVIIEELHSRGHDVTVLCPSDIWYIKVDSPHYKAITVNSSAGFNRQNFKSYIINTVNMRRYGSSFWSRLSLEYDRLQMFYQVGKELLEMVEDIFDDKELMQSLFDGKYDLVLTDPSVGGGVFLSHRLGLPLVLNVRWTIQGEGHKAIAPFPLSYSPIPRSELTDKMTFMQRVKNFLYYIFTCFQIWYIVEPNYKPFVHRHFGKDVHYMELFQ